MQAEHERFMNQLKEDGRRLQRHLESELAPSSPSGISPFAGFKRFIDENFNTLTEGFRNFPANLAEIRTRMQQEQERQKEEEADISRRWTGMSDSPDHIRMKLERTSPEEREAIRDASLLLVQESWKRNQHVPAKKMLALFADPQSMFGDLDRFASPMLSWGGACYYKPETGDNLPSTRSWNWTCGPTTRWLSIEWFKRDPYSPLRLEAHPLTADQGVVWRAAFEDLLNDTLDKPMQPRDRIRQEQPYGQTQSTIHSPGLDWMLSLQCRGILPPQFPRLYSTLRENRQEHQKSISDFISHGAGAAPWSNDSSFSFYSPVERDFSELMAAVGTSGTPESAPQPTYASQAPRQTERFATELDLYDEFHRLPDVRRLLDDLDTAIHEDDEVALIDVFHRWSQTNPDLHGLLQPMIQEFIHRTRHSPQQPLGHLPLLADALRNANPNVSENEHNEAIADILEHLMQIKREIITDSDEASAWERLDRILSNNHNHKTALMTRDDLLDWADRMEEEVALSHQRVVGKQEPTPALPVPDQPTPQLKKPDVLSALTTTHTTRMPDGTVTTKVVLKQRFADGREETHESVHTEHKPETPEPEEKPKKKGWFWS